MLGTYAWDPDHERRDAACGDVPATRGRERALSLAFSTCARRRIESYSGGLAP